MPKDSSDDIRDLMAEERSRGKRPFRAEARKLEKERLEALRYSQEQDVIGAIRALGHGGDSEELEKILKIWRALSSSKKR